MLKPIGKEYTWGVKNRSPEYVVMYNMTKDAAEKVAAEHPDWWVVAAIDTKWYKPLGEKALLINGGNGGAR